MEIESVRLRQLADENAALREGLAAWSAVAPALPDAVAALAGRGRRVLILASVDAQDVFEALAAHNEIECVPFGPRDGPMIAGPRFNVVVSLERPTDDEDAERRCRWLRHYLADDGYALFALAPGAPARAFAEAAGRTRMHAVALADGSLVLVHPTRDPRNGWSTAKGSGSDIEDLREMVRDAHVALAERDSLIAVLTAFRGRGEALGHRLAAWRSTGSGRAVWLVASRARVCLRQLRSRVAADG